MAVKSTILHLTHESPIVLGATSNRPRKELLRLFINFLFACLAKTKNLYSFDLYPNGSSPTPGAAAVTLSSVGAGDGILVNGALFVGTSNAAAGNNQFLIGGSDTLTATNLVTAVNASTDARVQYVAQASNLKGTLTCASVVAGNTAIVGGFTFTAITGTAAAGSFNFDRSGSDNQTATNLAAAIAARPELNSYVVAFATTNVVSLLALPSTLTSAQSVLIGGSTITAAAFAAGTVVGISSLKKGVASRSITVQAVGKPATGTVTYSGSSGAQTITLNGVANVYNATGATDAANAAAAAAAINVSSNALVQNLVLATQEAGAQNGICRIYSLVPGPIGNAFTLAVTGTGATASGARLASGTVEGVQASGTVTITGGSGTETATINGVAINATWAASDNNTATLLRDAINSSTNALVQGFVTATASTNVVTITATKPGVSGNGITLAGSGTGVAASGARLTGGAAPAAFTLNGNIVPGPVSGVQLSAAAGGDVAGSLNVQP